MTAPFVQLRNVPARFQKAEPLPRDEVAAGFKTEPSKPQMAIKVRRYGDGYAVEIWGSAGGKLSTIARSLSQEDAVTRATIECSERGFAYEGLHG